MHIFILQGWLIAPFFVWRFCSCSGLLVRVPGFFCVRGILRIFIERKLSTLLTKRPAKDAPKIAVHLSNPRGRTWTASDQFSAPFAVVKQYHIAGNTVVNSCLKIRNNDDRDFAPKMTFVRTLKIL